MNIHNLLNNTKITRISADGAGAASANPTKMTIVDMMGFDSVCFVAMMGNVLTTSVLTLRAAGATSNSSGAMALLTGTATFTAGATDADDNMLILDVVEPPFRYIECQLFHVTANGPFDGVLAIQYNAARVPTTQGSTVIASTTADSPVLA